MKDEENEFIWGLNAPVVRTWLNIANMIGEYVASDGSSLQYTNWQSNEPKNRTGSEYGQDTHSINLNWSFRFEMNPKSQSITGNTCSIKMGHPDFSFSLRASNKMWNLCCPKAEIGYTVCTYTVPG